MTEAHGESIASARDACTMRRSKWACLLYAALLPFLIYGTLQNKFSTAAIAQWLPSDGNERERYSEFLKLFEDDLFLVISWPNCDLDNPDVAKVASTMRVAAKEAGEGLVRRIWTSEEIVQQLTSGPARLQRDDAIRRLRGFLIGKDDVGAIVLELSQDNQDEHARALDLALSAAKESAGLERSDLRIGGSAYEAVFIAESSERSLKWFVVPSFAMALLIALFSIGNLRLTLIVLLIAGFGQLFGLALLYFSGGQLNAVLIVLPSLLFMLTLSAAVHLVNYYKDSGGDSNSNAAIEAIRVGWMPCALATVTTAVGFSSLAISRLQPIREFGIYSAIGLVVSTVVLLTSFPYLVSIGRSEGQPKNAPKTNRLFASWTHWSTNFSKWIIQRSASTTIICCIVLCITGAGLPLVKSTFRLDNMFESDSEILRNYSWLEENVGPFASVEIICTFEPASEMTDLQKVAVVQQVHQSTRKMPEVGGVYSAMTFLPDPPKGRRIGATARRAVFKRKLRENKRFLSEQGVMAIDGETEHWRVSVKVPAVNARSYNEQRLQVQSACQEITSLASENNGVRVMFTGLSPVFHEAQQQMLTDLVKSFLMAFIWISPIMMLVLRGVVSGLLGMLPNVAPVILVCGVMGWTGVPLDIASILTVSVALGIAVDDTLHFLTWFARSKRLGASHPDAAHRAFQKCASAMLQTTLICCCTMLVFLPTEFLPTRKFAILISLMLVAAIAGDLILLPAFLASRFGKWIMPNQIVSRK